MASGNSEPQSSSSSGGASQKAASAKSGEAGSAAGSGLRGVRTTSLFRAVNFELFVKPNKVVMAFGLVAITGCVAYVAYMNATQENKATEQIYEQYRSDGSTEMARTKRSKWD